MEQRIRKALADRFSPEVAEGAKLDNLGGHASLRIYWRIELAKPYARGESTLIAMVLPQTTDALKSEEGSSSTAPRPDELPFVTVQRYLDRLGVRVPAIEHIDMELGVLLLEDLGDTLFENVYLETADENQEAVYREAIDLLVDFQKRVLDDGERSNICWQRAFDRELLRWELDHYLEWGLDALYGREASEAVRAELDVQFDGVVDDLLELPTTLVLRDYQSRNIMRKGADWYIIDFQDALVGPYVYDLVALLRDSYIALDFDRVERLVDYYAGADLPWCSDPEEVRRAFHLQTIQRKLKDAGRFVYIDRVKKNPDFLPYFEPSLGYVADALRAAGRTQLHALLTQVERKLS